MSNSEIDLDLTEIHFDFFCKVGGTPQMLHALIAAQEDDVRRWSSCPSFGPFIHKLFVQSPDVSRLGPIHPTGSIGFLGLRRFSNFLAYAVTTPIDATATLTLHSPSDGEPFPFPIRDILARFHEYGQYELHKVRMAIRFDNKTIKYVDVQAFPSENFFEACNKDQLQKVNIMNNLHSRCNELSNGRDLVEMGFNTQTAFEEHLEVIRNRMRDNGYNIKIHVPEEVFASEVKRLERFVSQSGYGSFDLGAYMDTNYFLPLIGGAVVGTIKNGEFAIFEFDGTGDVQLRRNHKID
ncbi:uncharacterized protein FTJAE_4905 [Fusarium tjaetaba]|uniref:Uncharacterized protein n=1 Tax=Fusarium tjaetaba TaxID=1567544 RepID=A0A8H5RPE1_9HYPO|nr:uncharacterized protein FTJAE_4905 [Fusarium tjaetaba]KAF5639115.1 hypothetical protein FTJAE_4905 [Fusarium tjaetaba]